MGYQDPGQQVIYVDENGQQVADPNQQVIYVDENGQQVAQPQQMMYAAPQQMGYQDPGQQLIYVDENGQQDPAPVPSMVQHVPVGPTMFNISPEQFAQLAQGHAMSQDQINGMLGQGASAEVPAAEPTLASAEQAVGT